MIYTANIKFHFLSSTCSFKLNTTIESPHESQVNTLCLRSTKEVDGFSNDPMAVTTSKDKKFKLWRLLDDENVNG